MSIEFKRPERLLLVLLLSYACMEGELDVVTFSDEQEAGSADASAIDSGGDAGSTAVDAAMPLADDAGAETDSPDSDLPEPEELAGMRADAICAALEACQGADLLSQSMDGQPCAWKIGGVFANRNMAHFGDSVLAGRVIFRPDNATLCIEDLAATGCDVKASRWRQVCGSTVEGSVETGGQCVIDEECSDSAYCERGADGTVCPGECVALKGENNSCTSSEQCEHGLVCFGGTCEAPLLQEDDCTGAPELCRIGLLCLAGSCQPQANVYGAGPDEPCDPFTGELCSIEGQQPLVCAEQPIGSALCRERVAAGAVCRRSVPSQCPVGQYCEAEAGQEGNCKDLPGLYEECRPENKDRRCGPGLVCDTYQSGGEACVPIKDNGGTCEGDASCFSGRCDDDLTCAPPPACVL